LEFRHSKEKLIDITKKILRYLVILTFPLAVGLTVTADSIIRLLYSEQFHEAGIVLKITSWIIVVGFIQTVFSVLLTAINRQKEKTAMIGINFGLSTLLNVIFIFYLGYVGAAIVKIISDILALIFFACLVSKYLTNISIFRLIIKPGLASALMAVFVLGFRQWSLIFLIPVSGLVYLIAFVLLGGVTQEEMRLFKNSVRKRFCGEVP
jgi:O-antigen/teichoic acid export membrane protein